MAYVIGSDKGKKIAENMTVDSTYTASDGSTWTKKKDGSVSVKTSSGETFDNAYTPSSRGSKNSPYTGSSTGVQTYNSSQEAIKNQMNQNSIDWWSADDEGKKVLEAQNRELAAKLGGNVSFDAGTGTWNGAAANYMYTTSDIEGWGKDYAENNPKPTAYRSDPRIDALLNQILNREDFSYDAESDPLYQQYARMYQREGDRAMKETMAEAASGAGGMNTYAITAAQQANNYYNSQLNDRIPELYQLAYEMYLNDKESMVQDLGLLQSMDATQYNRYRDTMNDYYTDKNFAYGAFQDAVQQGNWQTNFDYNAMWDNKNFMYDDYWKNKEFDYNDYWANKEWEANQADKEYDKGIYNKETAEARANELIQYGELPGDDILAQAGMDKAYALQLVNAVRRKLGLPAISTGSTAGNTTVTSGGGGSGTSSGGSSTGGSGSETKKVSGDPVLNLGIGPISDEKLEELVLAEAVIVKNDGTVKWASGYGPNNYQKALKNTGYQGVTLW